jgi:hypothetical protein
MIRPVYKSDVLLHTKDIQNPIEFTLFPNPARDYIHIHNNSPNNISEYHITIRDISGRLLVHQSFTEDLTINNLTNGIYILQVSNGIFYCSKKFIVSK